MIIWCALEVGVSRGNLPGIPRSFQYLMSSVTLVEAAIAKTNPMFIHRFNRNKDQGTGNGIAVAILAIRYQSVNWGQA